ncbi:MAG TPA: helix-turn-helix transcriptional regulator [Candidatus Syntrophosphaera sp.]|nr:helix-turn-helix transcriptional regulator [Candidatus Syntrophosphaera sp.]
MTGGTLKDLRKKHGLTLKQVSERTGISLSLLSMYEGNKVKPSAVNLAKLSTTYNTTMEAMMNDPARGAPEQVIGKAPDIHDQFDDTLFVQQQGIIAEQNHTIKLQSESISKLVTILSQVK